MTTTSRTTEDTAILDAMPDSPIRDALWTSDRIAALRRAVQVIGICAHQNGWIPEALTAALRDLADAGSIPGAAVGVAYRQAVRGAQGSGLRPSD
jgi:hypothetical protein